MRIVDVLDREWARFQQDFRACAGHADLQERRRLGQALVQRVAACMLAQENVLLPALQGLDDEVLRRVRDEHGRFKWRVADALMAFCGDEARAWRSLRKTLRHLRVHVQRVREDLYPLLRWNLPQGLQHLLGDAMLHWFEANRRQAVRAGAAPTVLRRSPRRALPAWLYPARLPVLRHVVLLQDLLPRAAPRH